jgi:hypothetical protein
MNLNEIRRAGGAALPARPEVAEPLCGAQPSAPGQELLNLPWNEIFLVNLDTDIERLQNINVQLDQFGLTFRKLSNNRDDDWRDAPAS